MFEPILGMITPTVAVIILIIALILFGPGKLPGLGKALGQGIKEFKSATEGGDEEPKKESSKQVAQAVEKEPEKKSE
jgi:sec-independent protein translocase protein TatA